MQTKWDYRILTTWWEESGRSDGYAQQVSYRHVWQPGEDIEEFANGMSKNLGSEGWELVSTAVEPVSYLTRTSPQGDNWASFPTYRLFFKRPAS